MAGDDARHCPVTIGVAGVLPRGVTDSTGVVLPPRPRCSPRHPGPTSLRWWWRRARPVGHVRSEWRTPRRPRRSRSWTAAGGHMSSERLPHYVGATLLRLQPPVLRRPGAVAVTDLVWTKETGRPACSDVFRLPRGANGTRFATLPARARPVVLLLHAARPGGSTCSRVPAGEPMPRRTRFRASGSPRASPRPQRCSGRTRPWSGTNPTPRSTIGSCGRRSASTNWCAGPPPWGRVSPSSRLLSDLGIDQRRWHDYHTGRLWMHEEEWAGLALLLLDKQGP